MVSVEKALYFNPIHFDSNKITVPSCFNFPFNHEPNAISLLAAEQVKKELKSNKLKHDFGSQGKMFGVLIVKSPNGELGFLKAFSGKLEQNEQPKSYVPPVFDVHQNGGFFKKAEQQLDLLTEEIQLLKNTPNYQKLNKKLNKKQKEHQEIILEMKGKLKQNKALRKEERDSKIKTQSPKDYELLNQQLNEISKQEQIVYKKERKALQKSLELLSAELKIEENKIKKKKKERRELSSRIQTAIFESYSFLNAKNKTKNLLELFEKTSFGLPPSGAGECCAPRLLQYAYKNNFEAICFTEFWWGESPESEIRMHQQHYPACRGKCGPILQHMLKGLKVDKDPLVPLHKIDSVTVLYEDASVLVVEKPANILSVPGKEIEYSLASIIQKQFPNIEGPGLVHRLDFETSGIVLVAKNLSCYKALQNQFTARSIRKKYVAILQEPIASDNGKVTLPLRVDLFNRPRQLVCLEHGKNALTKYSIIKNKKTETRIAFYPVTGRTHQLRVHSAHKNGLNSPILGDSLYGTADERLYLHAASLVFKHPVTNKKIEINSTVPF